jgi:pilus assembly protein CpaC
VLNGFVDRPDHVGPIMRLAEDYSPKVINNITVGGVQQVLLKVKVMEVSRTKLRRLGVDWAYSGSGGGFAFNSINDIITRDSPNFFFDNAAETFSFGIVDGGQAFFATLDALQERRVAKILAEPNIVAVSGRPAKFLSGGEFAYTIPQGGGGGSTFFTVEFKPFGTIIDFVPVVLGNGNIRLEVRPEVSTPDFTLGTVVGGSDVPGLRKRFVETAVEMKAGQTFALAGLVEERVDTINRGLPYISDVPILGIPFRRTEDEMNEIELLILVTPEFVDGMEPHQAPCGGPGYATTSPTTSQLYCGGHVEVPPHCNPISGPTACGEQGHGYGCSNCPNGNCGHGRPFGSHPAMITDGVAMPGGVGYDEPNGPTMAEPQSVTDRNDTGLEVMPAPSGQHSPNATDLELPSDAASPTGPLGPGASYTPGGTSYSTAGAQYTTPRPYSPTRQPAFMRNAANPNNRHQPVARPAAVPGQGGLFGPVGYDPQ